MNSKRGVLSSYVCKDYTVGWRMRLKARRLVRLLRYQTNDSCPNWYWHQRGRNEIWALIKRWDYLHLVREKYRVLRCDFDNGPMVVLVTKSVQGWKSCFGVEGIDEFCLRCFVLEVPVKTRIRHVYEVVKSMDLWLGDMSRLEMQKLNPLAYRTGAQGQH